MQEYIFLYALALIWTVFAAFQDVKTTLVSNWLSFSLIAFVLAYRSFYAIFAMDFMFFVYGLIGILIFIGLGFAFYYSRVFGGGDAKLLMGIGGILPYESYFDLISVGFGFILLLFLVGAIYTLIYSLFLIGKDINEFKKEFKSYLRRFRFLVFFGIVLGAIILFLGNEIYGSYLYFAFLVIVLMPLLFIYVKTVEKKFMIRNVSPNDLIEGDWLERDVKSGRRMIRRSVHGLSLEEINILKKVKKKVWIKTGVPFTPVFVISLIIFLIFLRYSSF